MQRIRWLMPIEVATTIQALDQETFHALDHRVMRVVFDVHNEFGRLLDEDLYKREIATRCTIAGLLPAEREVRIRVIHESFVKDYFMDLLLCRGFMLEGKVAERLVATHRGQALNCLLRSCEQSSGSTSTGASWSSPPSPREVRTESWRDRIMKSRLKATTPSPGLGFKVASLNRLHDSVLP